MGGFEAFYVQVVFLSYLERRVFSLKKKYEAFDNGDLLFFFTSNDLKVVEGEIVGTI